MVEEVRKKLENIADFKYKKFNEGLCPDTKREILGIKIPVLRKLAKELVKQKDWKIFVKNNNVIYFEEVLLQGLVIGYSKVDFKEKLKLIKQFVPRIDSWEISDTFVPTLKIKDENLEEYWKFIEPYSKSKKEFDVRFCVISMLDYFLIEEYIDKVIEIVNNINHDGYYVKMSIAWLLAEIGVKYNEKCINYLTSENNLDKFTFNKALQKMIESYRISNEQKDILRKMKIK